MVVDTEKGDKEILQLLNYIVGEAKMAIYISGKNKLEDSDTASVWRCNRRIILESNFFFFLNNERLEKVLRNVVLQKYSVCDCE